MYFTRVNVKYAYKTGHNCEAFKCDDLSQALDKIYACISNIRRWIIIIMLKINDSKTEFLVFRSPMLKHDLSDLSVNIKSNMI